MGVILALLLSVLVNVVPTQRAQAATVLGQRIADIVSAEVGAYESPAGSNLVPNKGYGKLGQAWCAHFVTWALQKAGVSPSGSGRGTFNTNVARAWSVSGKINGYGRYGTSRDPQVGDLLIDRYDGTSNSGGHISVVVKVAVNGYADLVETVGGNEGDAVRRRVKDLDIDSRYLVTIAEIKNSTSVTAPSTEPTTSTASPYETTEAPASDFDNDGRSDLAFLKVSNTGTSSTELHATSSASGFKQFLAHSGSGLSTTESSNGLFAIGEQGGDNREDLFFIKTKNASSGNVEVHILNASSGYKSYSLHQKTPIGLADVANGVFKLCDCDGDKRSDLAFVKTRNTGQGKVEVHVLSGASSFTSFTHHKVSPLWEADRDNGVFSFGDVDGDAKSDFGFIKTKNTADGKVEMHVASASSGYGTWIANKRTPLTATLASASVLQLAHVDSDGKADLVAIQTSGTASGMVEVHAVSAASGYATWIANKASAFYLGDASNGTFSM